MSLYPREILEYVALNVPRGLNSSIFCVDTENGDDGTGSDRWTKPFETLAAAEDACTRDRHDAVLFIARDTADNPAASIVWDKDHTHLIGLSGNLPGEGQRCRVEATAAVDLTPVITFSGKGGIVRNMKFCNLKDADTDSGCVIVSGGRNYFENVFFAGMGHATPAARAGSYSLTLSGEECYFKRCAIGLDTIKRAAANAELVVNGGTRSMFEDCLFESYSETAGKFLVSITDLDRWIRFKNCTFYNFWENWVDQLTNAINDAENATHYIILEGNNTLVGVDGWADTVSYIFSAAPVPDAGFGIAVNPTS